MNVKRIQIFVAQTQTVVTFLAPMTVHAKKDLHQGKANCNAKVWTKGNLVKGLLYRTRHSAHKSCKTQLLTIPVPF